MWNLPLHWNLLFQVSLHFTPNSIPQISLALTQEFSPENREEIITELENIIAELKEKE